MQNARERAQYPEKHQETFHQVMEEMMAAFNHANLPEEVFSIIRCANSVTRVNYQELNQHATKEPLTRLVCAAGAQPILPKP